MAPHFGLIDSDKLSRKEEVLMRAKLHWRCGTRRIREGKTASGVATLYDALLSGMRWYIMNNLMKDSGDISDEELENERYVLFLLKKAEKIGPQFDMNQIQDLVDMALMEEKIKVGQEQFIEQLEGFLTGIHVLPFEESELPPEDPATF
jgi:hypothetical protein